MISKRWLMAGAMSAASAGMAVWLVAAPVIMPAPLLDPASFVIYDKNKSPVEPDPQEPGASQSGEWRSQDGAESAAVPGPPGVNPFGSFLSEPTATPTVTPRPPEPPRLTEGLKRFRLDGMVGKIAFVTDTRTNETRNVAIGESVTLEDRRQAFDARLKRLDATTFEAEFEFQDQTCVLKLTF